MVEAIQPRPHDVFLEIGPGTGALTLPLPQLPGRHQSDNAALAVAMLRHQDRVTASPAAMAEGIRSARWPARLQLLGQGPLTAENGFASECETDDVELCFDLGGQCVVHVPIMAEPVRCGEGTGQTRPPGWFNAAPRAITLVPK